MSNIKVERAIYGSLDNVVGDGLVSYSSGVTKRADIFKGLFDSNANKLLSKDYASLLLFLNPDHETYSCVHIQGSHVEFPADGRSYCTRCIYEYKAQQLDSYGFFPITLSLPKMEHRQDTDFNANPDVDLYLLKQSFDSLDKNGKNMYYIINHAILNGQQIFIRIDTQSEDYLENHIFESPKLKTILNAFDSMPKRLKKYLSLAFSTDAHVNHLVNQVANPLVIVHHDDISNWKTDDGLIVNWETETIECPIVYNESSKYVREICEIPLISDYLSRTDSTPSNYDVFRWIGNMRTHLDLAIDNDQPNSNDVILMDLAYTSCESKNAYRHYDMASKLYHLIIQGGPSSEELKVTRKRLINDYPALGDLSPQNTDFYKRKILNAKSLAEIERILSECPFLDEIISLLSSFFKEHEKMVEEYMNETDKYPYIKQVCHDHIITIIKEESLEYILSHKYQNNSSISFTLDIIKPKVKSWESLCRACQIMGWSYATTLIENNEWQVSSLEEFNKDINYYRTIQKNKEQVNVKNLFAKQIHDYLLQQNLTLASLCDLLRKTDGFLLEFIDWLNLGISDYGQNADKKLRILKKSPYYQPLLSIKETLDKKKNIVTTEDHEGNDGQKGVHELIPDNKIEGGPSLFSFIKFFNIYHIDYVLIAFCAALLTYLSLTFHKGDNTLSTNKPVVGDSLTFVKNDIDTLFIDADIPTGKIERTTLAKISNRVLERSHFLTNKVSTAILCLHTEDKDIRLDINNTTGFELDSIYSLFGNSLTSGSYSLKDTISAFINGQDSSLVVDKKHRFHDLIKGCRGTIKTMVVANDSKKDTISLDNIWFKQTFQVEADIKQILYFFYIVNKVESWRELNKIKDNLNY